MHTGPPQTAGRWWHCSRGSDRPGGQRRGWAPGRSPGPPRQSPRGGDRPQGAGLFCCGAAHRAAGGSRTGVHAGRGQRASGRYLGRATVTLLPTLHKQVPAHRVAHQPAGVRGVGQAGCPRLLHEHLQVGAAALAEHSGEPGAGGAACLRQGCGGGGTQGTLLCKRPPASPDAGCHDAAAALPWHRAVTALDVLVVVHAQVVAHLVGHGGRHADGVL